jgi:capsular exopolysaccharide synthesis family protein
MNYPNQMDQKNTNGNGQPQFSMHESQEPQVSFRDYIRVLYKGRFLILSLLVVVMAATIYYTFTTEPVYEASAKLMIEEKGGMTDNMFDFTGMMKKETMINNQVEILKSRTLAEYVIKELESSPGADKLRVLGNFPDGEEKTHLIQDLRGWIAGLLPGEPVGEPLLEEKLGEIVQGLRASIAVNPIRNTDMIEIKVSGFSASEAAYVTNKVATVYENLNQQQSQAEVREVKTFLEDQLKQFSGDLNQAEESLKNYQESAKVIALDQETEELVRKIAEFETLYNEAKTEMEAYKQRLKYIDGQLLQHQVSIDMSSIASQPYLAELRKLIAEKETRYASMIAKVVELNVMDQSQHQLNLLEKEIDGLKEKFRQEATKVAAADFIDPAAVSGDLITAKIAAETEIQALQPKVKALEKIVAEYNSNMEEVPAKSLRLARLMRQREVSEKIFIMLQEKYQESKITEVGQLGNVRLIDPAKPPKFPVKPKKKLNLILGFLVGLGLGVGLAFVMEYMDNSVNTMEDVEHLNLALLASIPFIKPEKENGFFDRKIEDPEAQDINERLITHLKPKSPISEAYRTLRTNITFSSSSGARKTIMVSSSGPKEGKSTSISNLAITFAQMGNKTLLVDGDLRRPMLHKLFALNKAPGLTNVLVGRESFESTVKKIEGLPSLDVLTCGVIPPNPAEILGSDKMREFLEELKKQYDIILIDAPPVIAVTDPSILARLVDGVVLIIRSGQSKKDAVVHAVDQLKRVEAPLLGVLLNGIQASNVYGSYYYYNYYHYYYGQDGERKKKKRAKRKSKTAY